VVREEIEAVVARERPGWRVAEVVEINDESGPTFEVIVERGDERRTVLVSADERMTLSAKSRGRLAAWIAAGGRAGVTTRNPTSPTKCP